MRALNVTTVGALSNLRTQFTDSVYLFILSCNAIKANSYEIIVQFYYNSEKAFQVCDPAKLGLFSPLKLKQLFNLMREVSRHSTRQSYALTQH